MGSLLSLNFYPCDQGQVSCSNNNGKIWRQTITTNGTLQAVQEYRYDALNRLLLAEEKATAGFSPACPDSSAVWTQQNTYDPAGNRTAGCRGNLGAWTGEVSTFSGSTNRIADSGWGYDAAGNITGGWAALTLAYDAESRQVAVCTQDPTGCVNQAGTGRTLYIIDGSGQRVQRQTPTTGAVTYVYDAFGNLAAEYGGNPLESGTQYVAVDQIGSTRLVMEGTQATERHDYLPFGAELTGIGAWRTTALGYGIDTIRQKFTGQERDSESQFDFFQARYFHGPQGRFASVDPGNAGADPMDPQSWNGYAYVGNGPLMYTDPSGLDRSGSGGAGGLVGFLAMVGEFALGGGFSDSWSIAPPGTALSRLPSAPLGGDMPGGGWSPGSLQVPGANGFLPLAGAGAAGGNMGH